MSMSLAFVLLGIGFVTSFVLLAVGGAVGGYAATIAGESGQPIDQQLGAYVYPITFSALTAVVGAALTVVALIRAR